MDEIKNVVARAQQRLAWNRFLQYCGWTVSAALLVAFLAILAPRIWVLGVNTGTWDAAWLGGGIIAGLAAAGLLLTFHSGGKLEAAIELDRRYGLKERITSSILLSESERASEAGLALTGDATHRAARLDVSERFRVEPTWRMLLPLAPGAAVLIVALFFSPLSRPVEVEASDASKLAEQARIREVSEALKKKLEEKKQSAEEKGLVDAKALFERLEKHLSDLNDEKKKVDQKEATIKLNELAKEIKEKRDEMAKSDEVRQQLSQLGKLDPGPADKFAKAVKDGDMKKAAEQIKELKDKLDKNELGEKDKEQLEKQLDQMEKKLRDRIEKQQQAENDLKQKLEQAQKQGDAQAADKLQQQLDKLQSQQPQMDALQKLADTLNQANQNMKQGNNQQAAKNLDDMKKDFQQKQQDLDQMQQMDEMLDQIADARQSMKCEKCGGKGCKNCQGGGKAGQSGQGEQGDSSDKLDENYDPSRTAGGKSGEGQGQGQKDKNGQPGQSGEGQARGRRPDGENKDGKFFDAQVGGKVTTGPGVIAGKADGPNVAGQARVQVEQAITEVKTARSDPLNDQEVPKDRREHARQYFDRIREGK